MRFWPLRSHPAMQLTSTRSERRYSGLPSLMRRWANVAGGRCLQLATLPARSRPREPSGYTAEIVRPLLDDDAGIAAVHCVAKPVAQCCLDQACRKRSGHRGWRPYFLDRELVAGTLAQQFSPAREAAKHPHQYALSTRAGSQAVSRSRWRFRPGRQAGHARSRPRRPPCQCFYGSPSEFVWTKAAKSACAFLDDTYPTSQPCRRAFLLQRLEHDPRYIRLKAAKTVFGMQPGSAPPGSPMCCSPYMGTRRLPMTPVCGED